MTERDVKMMLEEALSFADDNATAASGMDKDTWASHARRLRDVIAILCATAPVAGRAEPVAWRRVRSDGVVTYWEIKVPDSVPLFLSAPSLPTQPAREADATVEEIQRQAEECDGGLHSTQPAREALEYIDMAENRLECEGCPECIKLAISYLQEARAALAQSTKAQEGGSDPA